VDICSKFIKNVRFDMREQYIPINCYIIVNWREGERLRKKPVIFYRISMNLSVEVFKCSELKHPYNIGSSVNSQISKPMKAY